jgi:hypothetical protein
MHNIRSTCARLHLWADRPSALVKLNNAGLHVVEHVHNEGLLIQWPYNFA